MKWRFFLAMAALTALPSVFATIDVIMEDMKRDLGPPVAPGSATPSASADSSPVTSSGNSVTSASSGSSAGGDISTSASNSQTTNPANSMTTLTPAASSSPTDQPLGVPDGSASSSSNGSSEHRTLTIILAVVLSTFGLVLLLAIVYFFRRYRRNKTPFSRLAKRGATPIDDDEIATWRTNTQAMAETSPGKHNHTRTASSIVFLPSPGQSWTVHSHPSSPSPNEHNTNTNTGINPNTTTHTISSPIIPFQTNITKPTTPPTTSHRSSRGKSSFRGHSTSRGNSRSSNTHIPLSPPNMPEPAILTARAPNSRSGLTDETVPGADPFLPPLKRQSTRLSKSNNGAGGGGGQGAHSRGHSRSKSRRSSRGSVASTAVVAAQNANVPGAPALGRFSFDKQQQQQQQQQQQHGDGRSRSFSGTGLGMNPYIAGGGMHSSSRHSLGRDGGGDPFAVGDVEFGGLSPPPPPPPPPPVSMRGWKERREVESERERGSMVGLAS